MRTVDEYIGDTCSAAAALNDKLEHHGTQYPSYDCKFSLILCPSYQDTFITAASHSCYVWCHKVGGGYMSQGWRLPDGTPCGRKLIAPGTSSSSSNGTMLSTGHCYNGQCRPFNCAGEMLYRGAATTGTPSPSASNVYSGRLNNTTSVPDIEEEEVTVDCPSLDQMLAIPGVTDGSKEEDTADYDSSYRLVRVRGGAGPKVINTEPPKAPVDWTALHQNGHHHHYHNQNQQHSLGPAQQNYFSTLTSGPSSFGGKSGNWSEWTAVTECQYSTACITTGRGFRLVTRECRRQ